jgi:protein-S-isoprenylcysteine O-methyltransferase Ste14
MPAVRPGIAIEALWIAWALSWLAAAGWSNKTEKRRGGEVSHRAPLIAGVLLLAVRAHHSEGLLRLWHVDLVEAWACAALLVAGFGFAWWARLHLGRLWSGTITRKEGHRVVDTGPYAIVRHPIYTGILLAVFGTMLAKGTAPGVAGAALILLALWLKARLEERWLASELDEGASADYRRRVPMLVPFGPRG